MIRVILQPEPAGFDATVRVPGNQFLAQNPAASRRQIKRAGADYWRLCLPQLQAAYGEICAYSAVWIPSSASVDHFQPRSRFHALAYEWSNFRLSDQKINHRKDDHIGVQDPFEVQPGWFVIDFATFYVRCGDGLQPDDENRVLYTISLLQLNDDQLVEQRRKVVEEYGRGAPLEDVERYYPFIALELKRQNLTEAIKLRFQP